MYPPFPYARFIFDCIEQMIQRHDQESLNRLVDQVEPFDVARDAKSVRIRDIDDETGSDALVQERNEEKQA